MGRLEQRGGGRERAELYGHELARQVRKLLRSRLGAPLLHAEQDGREDAEAVADVRIRVARGQQAHACAATDRLLLTCRLVVLFRFKRPSLRCVWRVAADADASSSAPRQSRHLVGACC